MPLRPQLSLKIFLNSLIEIKEKNMKKAALFLIIAPIIALSLAGIKVYYSLSIWKYQGQGIVFSIKHGEGFSSINSRLYRQGVISSARLFHRYNQFKGDMEKFKVGDYQIKTGINMLDLIELLKSGASITFKTTIPEGKNLFEIAKLYEESGILEESSSFIRLAKNEPFVRSLGIEAKRVEGYLYPDTYNFPKNSSPKVIIKAMVVNFKQKTKDLNFSHPKLSKHQIITLASIVEKETGAGFERPVIAGVFHNRLKKRMRLQSDPTTIYGIYENFNGNLRKKHLLEKTPYNTYKIPALPIGPISNPGIESIQATLGPKKHNYLYFVSKNDGTHIFSESYRQHVNAVNTWQKTRSNRAGRSWRDLNQKN